MSKKTNFEWFPYDLLVVVGHNPELAEIGNPHGQIIGLVWYVACENEYGDRFIGPAMGEESEGLREAEIYASWLNSVGALPGHRDYRTHSAYGSRAYQEDAPFEAEREREDEMAGCGGGW